MSNSLRGPLYLSALALVVSLGFNLFLVIHTSRLILAQTPQLIDNQVLPTAEADIRGVLDAQVEAWNRGDLDGFMAGYKDTEHLRFASGDTVTTGFAATKERYFKRYKADGKEMGKLTFSEVTVEVDSHRMAIVRGRWHLKYEKSADEPHGLFTLTMRWSGGDGWKITSDHTSAAEKK